MKDKVLKNTSVLIGAHILNKLFYFLTIILLTKLLGVSGFGNLTFAISFVILFSIFVEFGLNTLIIREVSRRSSTAGKYFGNGLLLKSILSVFTLILILSVLVSSSGFKIPEVIYILAVWMIIDNFGRFICSFFRAFQQMEYEAILGVIEKGGLFSLCLVANQLGWKIITVATIFLITAFFRLMIGLLILIKRGIISFKIDPKFCKWMLKESWPFALMTLFGLIYFRIDTVMLKIMKGAYEVGLYNASHKLMEGLMFLPEMFAASLFPVFSILFVSSKRDLILSYEKGFKLLFSVGLPIAIGGMILSDEIILFLYGEEFYKSAGVLSVLVWALFLIFLNFIVGAFLNSVNRQRRLMFNTGVCAFANIGLNFLFIPRWSYIGAGVATLISEGLLFFLGLLVITRYLSHSIKMLLKPTIAAITMGIIVYLLKDLNPLLVIAIGGGWYFSLLFLLRTFSVDEISFMREGLT